MFDAFESNPNHLSSSGHLAGSFVVASIVSVSLVYALTLAGQTVVNAVEKTVEVTFVEEIKNEPPPPPDLKKVPMAAAAPVVPAHLKTVVVDTPPPVKPLAAPQEISKAPLQEADPSQDKGVIVTGSGPGDPAGLEGGSQDGVAGGEVAAKPKVLAQALPENASPPRPSDDNEPPAYPLVAREAGKTGLVVLRVTIDEAGQVEDISIMKGEAPFIEAAVKAVKTWKYSPAMLDGKAIRVYRIIKIPFQIKA